MPSTWISSSARGKPAMRTPVPQADGFAMNSMRTRVILSQ